MVLLPRSHSPPIIVSAGEGPSNINWSQPAIVFPFLVDILSSPSVYFPSIFEGMVISVGGLSEAVVKEASAGLLAYCMLCEEGIGLEPLARMIPRMFDKYRGNDRIIVPLLKTIDLLLRSGALASLERSETLGATFATLLHESVSAEHATSQVSSDETTAIFLMCVLTISLCHKQIQSFIQILSYTGCWENPQLR